MKQLKLIFTSILAVCSMACSQEQPEGKTAAAAKNSLALPLLNESGQNKGGGTDNANSDAFSEGGPGQRLDPVNRGVRRNFDAESQRTRLRFQRTQLSAEEIRKNREAAARLWAQRQANAREDIHSKDGELRLRALTYLDPDNANDLSSLKNALLNDSNPEVREEAAYQFSDVNRKAAEPLLIKALKDSAPAVAIAAIESLTALEGANKSAIIDAIRKVGGKHPDENVRDAAQSALEQMDK